MKTRPSTRLIAFIPLILSTGILPGCTSKKGEEGIPVAVGLGTPPSGQYEIHVGVEFAMTRREGPRLSTQGNPQWEEWIDEHFKLEDTGNTQSIKLSKTGNSRLIPSSKLPGTFDFYLSAPLKANGKYELNYYPFRAQKGHYRYRFTAPVGGKPPVRANFEPIDNPS